MADVRTAMVMAAGLGTRIRALANDRPKPLVEVRGKALIDYTLDDLAAGGVTRAVVNVHWMADRMEAHLAGRARPDVVISDERAQLMSTGGGLVQAAPVLGEGPVFCTNTDAIFGGAPGRAARRLAAGWDDAAMDALLLLVPPSAATGYAGGGDFALGADGRLSWDAPDLVFTGLQLISPRLFAGRPPAPVSTKAFWDEAMAAGRLYGLRWDGAWHHVGDPQGHAAAEAALGANAGGRA